MTARRSSAKCPNCPVDCFCGSTKEIQQNHPGGWHLIPWFTYPFCKKDHSTFHVMCDRAGVDFRRTTNKSIRLIQALKAMLVGMWMVVDLFEKHVRSQSEDQS